MALVSPHYSATRRGFDDLVRGLRNWRVWYLIGTSNIRRRYARSRVGQFWTTLSMGLMITIMGLIWSILWNHPLHDIFPYIATSLVLWSFLTGTINDACSAIINSKHYFLNQSMSLTTPIYAAVYGQLVILLHNMVIVAVVFIIFPPSFNLESFFFIPGFFVTLTTLAWVSCIVAVLCARYRDVIQLISNILTTAMYVTPVIFKPDFVPLKYQWINYVNPFAIFLSIMRDPLLGRDIAWQYWTIAIMITIAGLLFTVPFIGRFGKRVVFWV